MAAPISPREPRARAEAVEEAGAPGAIVLHRREAERLESLISYRILDTPPEAPYDAAARLAAVVCGAPAAMVAFVDEHRRWLKASVGLRRHCSESPRADSFCSDVVARESALVIEDALADPRYREQPLVRGEPLLRSYAGVPLIGRDGLPLGTLCAMDWRPRPFTSEQIENLAALAASVVTHLELRRVDRAMGRDPDSLMADALDPMRLRHGIEAGEFVCRFQPIVELESAEPRAFEALARWCHPELGVIPPALFLPAMERTGLMQALGRCVLDSSLDLAVSLRARSGEQGAPTVAVNVSGTQLETPGLTTWLAEALAVRGLPAAALCVEITESVPLEGGGHAVAELVALRELGVGIALDDYGAGNATVGKVLDLPVTALKLDRSLTRAIADNPRSRAVVRSTLALAEQIDLEVSCEGIETPAQLRALRSVGATLGQGWLFSAPLDLVQLERFLSISTAADKAQRGGATR